MTRSVTVSTAGESTLASPAAGCSWRQSRRSAVVSSSRANPANRPVARFHPGSMASCCQRSYEAPTFQRGSRLQSAKAYQPQGDTSPRVYPAPSQSASSRVSFSASACSTTYERSLRHSLAFASQPITRVRVPAATLLVPSVADRPSSRPDRSPTGANALRRPSAAGRGSPARSPSSASSRGSLSIPDGSRSRLKVSPCSQSTAAVMAMSPGEGRRTEASRPVSLSDSSPGMYAERTPNLPATGWACGCCGFSLPNPLRHFPSRRFSVPGSPRTMSTYPSSRVRPSSSA